MYVWSKLNHPNVLPFLGYFIDRSTTYPHLVSEWMVNGSLQRYIYDNQPSKGLGTIRMLHGISLGLDYLHSKGVVHGDLKSPNIVISPSGSPLIADFGLSLAVNASMTFARHTANFSGSSRWMAVELLDFCNGDSEGPNEPTKMTDVWAFGMVVYELLERDVPYHTLKRNETVILAIFRGLLPKYTDINPSLMENKLWQMCSLCWNKQPKDRPTIGALASQLQQMIDSLETGTNA